MNNTGKLQLLLISAQFLERGSLLLLLLTGGVLGKALVDKGPLITTINMDISSAGVSTVYKMDLFTSSFGNYKTKNSYSQNDRINKAYCERNALERRIWANRLLMTLWKR